VLGDLTSGGYSNKKAEYLMYQEEGTAEAGRVVSDMAGEGWRRVTPARGASRGT
jgi:hypothetical protein